MLHSRAGQARGCRERIGISTDTNDRRKLFDDWMQPMKSPHETPQAENDERKEPYERPSLGSAQSLAAVTLLTVTVDPDAGVIDFGGFGNG